MSAENDAVKLDEYRRKKRGEQPPSDEQKPTIRWRENHLEEVIDEAEKALIGACDDLYRQGQRIVRVVWDQMKVSGGGEGHVLRLVQISADHLIERFTSAANWVKWNVRSGDWVPCRCPDKVAIVYLARHKYNLPYILGVVTTPTLRPDGTIIEEPGYDESTGILFNPVNVTYPKVPENPTKEDAIAALDTLKKPFEKFNFKGAGLSVALSAVITAIVRRALPVAPMHAFSAPTAGAGKSILVDVASTIATGERAAVISAGDERFGRIELEKRITASQLAGDLILSIDNVEGPLGGDMLCQSITQHVLKLRRLGGSDEYDTPNTTCFFATGNNLTMLGDMTRRSLTAVVDINDERPELRRFEFHPVAMARANRPAYVVAALTIVRAYFLSEKKVDTAPLGSFEEWSTIVRDPLIWLGEADPIVVLEDVRKGDPNLSRLVQMMEAWKGVFGSGGKQVRDVIAAALATDRTIDGEPFLYPDLHDVVYAIGVKDGRISGEKVSWWLRRNAGRTVDGCRFERDPESPVAHTIWKLIVQGNQTDEDEFPY